MRILAAVVGATLALGACATAPSPEQDSAMRIDAAREVTCSGAEDCDVKWGRAVQYTLDHSAYRIQLQTDTMIQTAGPTPNSPQLAIVINRIPLGDGRQRFELRGGCDNMFGCSPSIDYAKAFFVRAVMDGKTGSQFF